MKGRTVTTPSGSSLSLDSPDRGPLSIQYAAVGDELVRSVRTPVGTSDFVLPLGRHFLDDNLVNTWFLTLLGGHEPSPTLKPRGRVSVVDLFSGAGGLALGARWAIEALGFRPKSSLAVDVDASAVDVNQYNNLVARTYVGSVRDLFTPHAIEASRNPRSLSPTTSILNEHAWLRHVAPIDILVGGPPCQGHSTFNNRTRGRDDRNQLYFWMAAAAHALEAKVVLIENVATVMSDAGDVVGMTHEVLQELGYRLLFSGVLSAHRMGIAQARRRHFSIAVREDVLGTHAENTVKWLEALNLPEIPIMSAIRDLEDIESDDEYDLPSELSADNMARIDYLFDEDLYELPDRERPISHQGGNTYPSVYGRLFPTKPAVTLTTGFLSPGRGRFVHPTRRRTLTLHEGARVQGFPDSFRFIGASGAVPTRTSIARMIGDAVPPPMAFHVVLAALAAMKPGALGSK